MPSVIFICTEDDGTWTAKQTNDDKSLTATVEGSRADLEKALRELVLKTKGGPLQINHSQVTPNTTVFTAVVSSFVAAAAAPAAGGKAAPAAAAASKAAAKEEKVEVEEEEDTGAFDLFD
eukprot:c4718_g1_i1.p1 GENE.c4718_g1_i1~~c4718_g1_i1.p1  ORF type:complete len:132 (-),score=50.21 c4718_g1_i1:96-455(-)